MKAQLVRWSARLERAALAFARSWVEEGEAASAAARAATERPRAPARAPAPEGAWLAAGASADGESPPEDWLRYVTARSQAPDGSRAYGRRAAAESAPGSPGTRLARPLRAARRLAAWARARVALPGARAGEESGPTTAAAITPTRTAEASRVAPRVMPPAIPGAAPQPRRSVAAAPPASAAASTPRARAPLGSEAPPRQAATKARPSRDSLAAGRDRETARPAPAKPRPQPRAAEPHGVQHARALQRAEPRSADARDSRAALPMPSARETAAPSAPRSPALPAPDAPTSARAARPMDSAGEPVAALGASSRRSRELGARPPRAQARAGHVEVPERAPRLRLRACPAPARGEAEPRAFEPPDALPAPSNRPSLRLRETARAGLAPRVAEVTTVSEPLGAGETERSRCATDRSLKKPDACRAALAAPLAPLPATREEGSGPQRFPELPRRDGGAPAVRAELDAWPELPPRQADAALARGLERRDQLLREQAEV